MLIRSVTAHAFGPLAGETLHFADGMTVVHGANESAKSSWHAAIYAALCGRRRGRAPSSDERRFVELHRPWDRTDWVVSAEVLLDDGRRVEVRQDLAGRVDCDVRDLDLGRDCSDEFLKDGTPDLSRWLGLDRHSFLATACVLQAQVLAVNERAGGLAEQLQRAAATAGADQTAAAALAHIEAYRREQVGSDRAPRRPLRIARAAVEGADAALADARAAHTAYQRQLVEVDKLRAEASLAQRRWRSRGAYGNARTTAATAAVQAEELRRRVSVIDAVLDEVGEAGPTSTMDDDALAAQVTAALSAWDSRPAEPAALPVDEEPPRITGDTVADGVDGGLLEAEAVVDDATTGIGPARDAAGDGVDGVGVDWDLPDDVWAAISTPSGQAESRASDEAVGDGADGGVTDGGVTDVDSVDVGVRDVDSADVDDAAVRLAARNGLAEDIAPGAVPSVGHSEEASPLTDQELWDLARDLEQVVPPVDASVERRVAVATAHWEQVSRTRQRASRRIVAAFVLVVLAAIVFAVGVRVVGMTVSAVPAGLLAVLAVALGGWGLAGSGNGELAAAAQDREAARLEAAAALRAEQAALAQLEGARSRASRLGLPRSGEGVRELARARAGNVLVADRERQWRQEMSEANAQWQREVGQARAQIEATERAARQREREAAQQVSQTRQQAEELISLTRQRALREISQTRQEVRQQISQSQTEARQQLTAAQSQLSQAQRRARDEVEAARQAMAAARHEMIAAREEIVRARQRVADQVVATAALCGLDVGGPEAAVAALTGWQADRVKRVAAWEDARLGWTRLQSLLGLGADADAVQVAHAVRELRTAATRAGEAAVAADARVRTLEGELAETLDEKPSTEDEQEAAQLRRLEELVGEAEARANLAEGARQALERGLASVSEAEEELARAQAELTRLRELDETLELTRSFLSAAQERAHRTIAPVLVESVGRRLPGATGGRYTGVIVDPEKLRVQVRGTAGRWRDADVLSHGTAEQIYLLLRIALAEHLARPGTVCPLLLDDVTVHADAGRTEQILQMLYEAAAERQIILFTQQDQVRDWAAATLDGSRHATHALVTLAPV